MTEPTGRRTASTITDTDLDQLYARIEQAELKAEAMTAAMESTAADALAHGLCHMKLMAQCTRAERAEAALTKEQQISRRLFEQRQEMATERYAWQERGDKAEAERDQARAALERVRHELAAIESDRKRLDDDCDAFGDGYADAAARLRATLDEHQEQPAPATHIGGNAEDCPACAGTNPPYPFICPGPKDA
ncbi:MAG TPA: hypothetical protein VIQ30_03150 [Pseudonocardia sp.]